MLRFNVPVNNFSVNLGQKDCRGAIPSDVLCNVSLLCHEQPPPQ